MSAMAVLHAQLEEYQILQLPELMGMMLSV